MFIIRYPSRQVSSELYLTLKYLFILVSLFVKGSMCDGWHPTGMSLMLCMECYLLSTIVVPKSLKVLMNGFSYVLCTDVLYTCTVHC